MAGFHHADFRHAVMDRFDRLKVKLAFLLWIASMFCLSVAAEGFHKGEWIMAGSIPITALAIGFAL